MLMETKMLLKIPNKLKESALKLYDIPLDNLLESAENPNEMSAQALDKLVDGIREEGFDEPIIVVPELDGEKETGNYVIASGHHRVKAAKILGLKVVPAVIKQGWDDDKRLISLVKRNILHGDINAKKFTELVDTLRKRNYTEEMVKAVMGFTKKDAFESLYQQVRQALPTEKKAKLDEAKEKIKTVDDLSNVLNTIMKEGGSTLDKGYMVFTYGGKKHHYIRIDQQLDELISHIEDDCKMSGRNLCDFFKEKLK